MTVPALLSFSAAQKKPSETPHESPPKGRTQWLDILKGLAIIAVIVDHSSLPLASFSIYSVSTFFLILGFNAYTSMARSSCFSFLSRLRACSKFIAYYILATSAYTLLSGNISLAAIYKNTVFFSAVAPFYFCAIYIQLQLITGALYYIIEKITEPQKYIDINEKYKIFIFLFIIFAISILNKNITLFPDLHGGGKYLFGEKYLLLTAIGMTLSKYYTYLQKNQWLQKISVIILILSPLYIKSIWANPPTIGTCVYTIALFLTVSLAHLEFNGAVSKLIAFIGRHSVHIFMYHLLIMQHFGHSSKIITFILALFLPIPIGYCIDYAMTKFSFISKSKKMNEALPTG